MQHKEEEADLSGVASSTCVAATNKDKDYNDDDEETASITSIADSNAADTDEEETENDACKDNVAKDEEEDAATVSCEETEHKKHVIATLFQLDPRVVPCNRGTSMFYSLQVELQQCVRLIGDLETKICKAQCLGMHCNELVQQKHHLMGHLAEQNRYKHEKNMKKKLQAQFDMLQEQARKDVKKQQEEQRHKQVHAATKISRFYRWNQPFLTLDIEDRKREIVIEQQQHVSATSIERWCRWKKSEQRMKERQKQTVLLNLDRCCKK